MTGTENRNFSTWLFFRLFGRFGIECDGFQSHIKDMDRENFNYALNRETFLTGMGWKMIHFSFDDVQQRPEVCRMLLQLVIGPYLIKGPSLRLVVPAEKEVLRFAWKLGKPIRPIDVTSHFKVNFRTARKWLQCLVEKGLMQPVDRGEGGGIRYYELKEGQLEQLLS